MSIEIELKLSIAPAQVGKLARCPPLIAATRSRPVTRRVYNVYYDTPERDLASHGMALRLRRVGGRWVQTLKAGGGAQTGLHRNGEYEVALAAPLLNFAALASTPAAKLTSQAVFRERLRPMFVTDFRRTARLIEVAPGMSAEFAVDRGTIVAGDAREPICELELELREGEADALFAFARRLLEYVPFTIGMESKAARGFALLTPKPAVPVRAVSPVIARTASSDDAFVAIARSCLQQLVANDRGVIGSDDVEYIHQARVAIRRLRSAFGLFRTIVPREAVATTLAEVQRVGAALGAARDWDVFVTETLPAVQHAFAADAGIASLSQGAATLRAMRRNEAIATIAAPAYTAMLIEIERLLASRPWRTVPAASAQAQALADGPAREFAATLFTRQLRRVRHHGKTLAALTTDELHALRIEIKKLRYAVEFFESLYPRRAVRAFLGGAADLQELLGQLNDATTTGHLLDGIGQDTADLRRAGGIVLGWTAARTITDMAHLGTAWRRFEAARPFW